MWNRRKEEEQPAPRPVAPPPPSPAETIVKEATPMSSMPSRMMEPESRPSSSATIGKSVMIKGQIFSREDLVIDGDMEGTVELFEHRLTIGPNGKVSAGIKAREIVVLGSVNGNVEAADKIEIRKEAKLVGDIKTARIVIEDGAYFKGSIDIVKAEARAEAKPAPVQAPKPQAPPAPQPVVAGSTQGNK